MKAVCLCILSLGLLSACSGPAVLRKDYARFSGCSEDKIETSEIGDGRYRFTTRYSVSGCGNSADYVYRLTDNTCASAKVTVARRHAKQFECPLGKVSVEYLDGGSWQAMGCGHTMTYQCLETEEEVLVRCVAETDERERRGAQN